MTPLLHTWTNRGRVLLVTAAPKESRAVLEGLGVSIEAPGAWRLVSPNERFDLLETGVGKANAAGAVARYFDPARHVAVINLGVAGMLPESPCAIGDVALATESVFADEGLETPDAFRTMAEIGFPLTRAGSMSVPASTGLFQDLQRAADHVGVIATISTCAASNARAHAIRFRTGAIAEAMEGAAAGAVVDRLNHLAGSHAAFAEIRSISNTTGDRNDQQWDLASALAALSRLAAML